MAVDLDAVLKVTVERIVGAMSEDGELHSGRGNGSLVDLTDSAFVRRIEDICDHVLLCLRSSELVAEVEKLRADRAAIVDWLVNGLVWPIDFALAGDTFPAAWRADLVNAWWRADGEGSGCSPEEHAAVITEEAGWATAEGGGR